MLRVVPERDDNGVLVVRVLGEAGGWVGLSVGRVVCRVGLLGGRSKIVVGPRKGDYPALAMGTKRA